MGRTIRIRGAWTYVAKDYEAIDDDETRSFEDAITLQDIPIVESQRPELLPLDLQAELHLAPTAPPSPIANGLNSSA